MGKATKVWLFAGDSYPTDTMDQHYASPWSILRPVKTTCHQPIWGKLKCMKDTLGAPSLAHHIERIIPRKLVFSLESPAGRVNNWYLHGTQRRKLHTGLWFTTFLIDLQGRLGDKTMQKTASEAFCFPFKPHTHIRTLTGCLCPSSSLC